MLVLQPEDGRCLFEEFLTFGGVLGILIVEVGSVLVVEVGVECDIMITSKYQSLLCEDT